MATALLIVDMQNFFAPMSTAAVPNVLKLATHFATSSYPVLFTQHGHSAAELLPPFPNQVVRKWGVDDTVHLDTHGWQFVPEIQALRASLPAAQQLDVVAKNTYDAFLGVDPKADGLDNLLRSKGVERVVVCGVMTDCSCDTSARAAFNRGYDTWLVGDACASANKEQHEAGLLAFRLAFGDVLDTDEVLERLRAEA
ncbi:uncharacterized protein K452DRAFT_362199 [Aplosporella prunicola CBS 121167]|uniref:Isochorismatase-like domain-containing protein n=1 Tax=Aplosporella prunicola CBS 121167 TaxID=1176127 RepID=A0A6A6B2I5_9PEZI|nr:uncharacterized protein K452DRAFT_362199 [Aplosporella prunicola CBS 121167]KAF2136941.1 hypothetical protein K452DRAFT_362199 [Aplosporella prunicola CBS 121167]